MTDKRYDLIITGQLLPNVEKSTAIDQLAKLLKLDAQRAEALLSGKPQRIKKASDAETAKRFIAALNKAGVELVAKPVNSAKTAAKDPEAPISVFSLNKEGEDLLHENERRHFEPRDVAGDFDIAANGSDIESVIEHKVRLNPPTDHLKLAEVGEHIPHIEKEPPKPLPDISHLSIKTH
jgi:hypothetical protein